VHTRYARILFSLSVFIGLSMLSATAASAGPINGRVLDPEGRPAQGATVLLVKAAAIVASAATDASGAFSLRAPDEGRFELRVALDGFRVRPVAVDASTDARDIGSVTLSVSAVSESVVVSASHTEIPLSTAASSVTVIRGEEVQARQTETLADALRLVPGLTIAQSGGRGALTSVFARGGESDYSLVFVDDVPANAFGGGFDFAQIPVVNIERIEIVRGPQSALYGSNAIGSVVRIVTKRGGAPTIQGTLERGSFDTSRATASSSGGAGAWQWQFSAERLATDGRNGERTDAGETIVNDDYERHSLAVGGGWSSSRGASIRGDVKYLRDERGNPGPFGSNPTGSFTGIDAVSRGENDRWLSSITATAPLTKRVRLLGQATHSLIDGTTADPYGGATSSSRRTSGRAQADITARADLDSSIGVELQQESARSTYITAAASREVPVDRNLGAVFGEARWTYAARLFVTAGLRVERITRSALPGNPSAFSPRPEFPDDTVVSTNPKIAAAWYVRGSDGDFTKVRASAGTGIRPPDGFEIAFTDNPSLKPERSRSFDAGLDQAFAGGRALVEATAFLNRYDDLIVAVGSFAGSSRYRTDNISNARSRGLELTGTVRPRIPAAVPVDLQLRLAYTLLDTEILAVDQSTGAPAPFTPGDALLRRPKHQFSADLLARAGRASGFIQAGGRSRVRDVDPSFGTFGGIFDAAGYSVWNIGADWRLFRGVEIFGRITNLFDRRYEEVFGYPALGRGAVAGLRVAASR
jgi:outer membrane cobalamin receptor